MNCTDEKTLHFGNTDIGKPVGNDIRDKKITLPLIYTLNIVNPKLRRILLRTIRHKNKDSDNINFVISEVYKAGGTDYAKSKMIYYRDEALKIIYEFSYSQTCLALEDLVIYKRIGIISLMAYRHKKDPFRKVVLASLFNFLIIFNLLIISED